MVYIISCAINEFIFFYIKIRKKKLAVFFRDHLWSHSVHKASTVFAKMTLNCYAE